jgi:hypothetical protein
VADVGNENTGGPSEDVSAEFSLVKAYAKVGVEVHSYPNSHLSAHVAKSFRRTQLLNRATQDYNFACSLRFKHQLVKKNSSGFRACIQPGNMYPSHFCFPTGSSSCSSMVTMASLTPETTCSLVCLHTQHLFFACYFPYLSPLYSLLQTLETSCQ